MAGQVDFFLMKDDRVMVIRNMGEGDVTFTSDKGSWNVTRALRDCWAGKHRGYLVDLDGYLANNAAIEVDAGKIAGMVADRDFILNYPPAIMVMEWGMGWFIDGHHRVRALLELGEREVRCWVIEEADSGPYRITFNGDRVAPWYRKQRGRLAVERDRHG